MITLGKKLEILRLYFIEEKAKMCMTAQDIYEALIEQRIWAFRRRFRYIKRKNRQLFKRIF